MASKRLTRGAAALAVAAVAAGALAATAGAAAGYGMMGAPQVGGYSGAWGTAGYGGESWMAPWTWGQTGAYGGYSPYGQQAFGGYSPYGAGAYGGAQPYGGFPQQQPQQQMVVQCVPARGQPAGVAPQQGPLVAPTNQTNETGNATLPTVMPNATQGAEGNFTGPVAEPMRNLTRGPMAPGEDGTGNAGMTQGGPCPPGTTPVLTRARPMGGAYGQTFGGAYGSPYGMGAQASPYGMGGAYGQTFGGAYASPSGMGGYGMGGYGGAYASPYSSAYGMYR